jgi:hypothetical protein
MFSNLTGLVSNSAKQKEKEKEKETKWVPNFHKYHILHEPDKTDRKKNKSYASRSDKKHGSQSTLNQSRSNEYFSLGSSTEFNPLEISEEEMLEEKKMLMRRKTRNNNLNDEELVLLGMYKLTPEQEEIYQQFVAMISTFDRFDMVSIIFTYLKSLLALY